MLRKFVPLFIPMKMVESYLKYIFIIFLISIQKKRTINVINRSMIIEKKTKWKNPIMQMIKLIFFLFLSSYCFSFIPSGCCISVWLRICSDVSHTPSTWSCCNAVGASLSWITFPLHTPGSTSNNRTTPKCTTRDTSSVRWGGSCVPSRSRPWHARRSLLLLFIVSFHNLHPSEKYKLRL